MRERLALKEEAVASIHGKYEELINCQTIEIPIYSVAKQAKKGQKGSKKQNRSKSQLRNKLQFVRELVAEEEEDSYLHDDGELED